MAPRCTVVSPSAETHEGGRAHVARVGDRPGCRPGQRARGLGTGREVGVERLHRRRAVGRARGPRSRAASASRARTASPRGPSAAPRLDVGQRRLAGRQDERARRVVEALELVHRHAAVGQAEVGEERVLRAEAAVGRDVRAVGAGRGRAGRGSRPRRRRPAAAPAGSGRPARRSPAAASGSPARRRARPGPRSPTRPQAARRSRARARRTA